MTFEDAKWIERFHGRIIRVRPGCIHSLIAYWEARAVIARHNGHTQGMGLAARQLAPLRAMALMRGRAV